jgi:hypothetical protein
MKKDEIKEEHIFLMEQVRDGKLTLSNFEHLKYELYKNWKSAED